MHVKKTGPQKGQTGALNTIEIIRGYGNVLVAFSGGADSTLLLRLSHDAAEEEGKRAVAATIVSGLVPDDELKSAKKIAEDIGTDHVFIISDIMSNRMFTENPVDRCYLCKRAMSRMLQDYAEENGFDCVVDGSNKDDMKDYRPGMGALRELGIKSPLLEAGLTKEDIRRISRDLGLKTADKPASPCLATRLPYGSRITKEKLLMINRAEEYLKQFAEGRIRVRFLDGELDDCKAVARIEVETSYIGNIRKNIFKIKKKFKELGFSYTEIEPSGYRQGRLNEKIRDAA